MSGRFRHKITLQTRTETLDAYGHADLSYTTLASVWAEMLDVSAGERLQSAQVRAEVTHRFTFLHAAAYEVIGPADRVSYDGRTFDILHVLDKHGANRYLEITAREVV